MSVYSISTWSRQRDATYVMSCDAVLSVCPRQATELTAGSRAALGNLQTRQVRIVYGGGMEIVFHIN